MHKKLVLLAIAAAALSSSNAFARSGDPIRTDDMFRGPRINQVVSSGQDPWQDAIKPDGTLNVDPTSTGSISPYDRQHGAFSQPRLQCDASPNTSEMRSNTFAGSLPSSCP